MNNVDPDEKILRDLAILTDQISLCQSMLAASPPSSSSSSSSSSTSHSDDEALLTVIGYLEACAPRLVELIEAAAQGALGASTFEECLLVNDRLTNVLDDVESGSGGATTTTTPAPPAVAFPAAASAGGGGDRSTSSAIDGDDDDLEDILQLGMGGLSVAMGGTAGKSTGLDEDEVMGGGGYGMMGASSFVPPRPSVHDDDPFAVIVGSGGGGGGGMMPDFLSGDVVPPTNDVPRGNPPSNTVGTSGGVVIDNEDEDFDAFFMNRTSAAK
jgi:hypothetical protein